MPCKVNISSFKSIVNIAIQNNANSIHMPLLEDYGSASINYPLLHLDDEELIVFFDELIDEYYNGLRERIKITYIDAIEKDIMNSNKKTSCLLGRQYGALYSNGVLYPCSETIIDKFQIGSFKNGTYTKNNSTMIFDGLHVDNYNKCKDCYLKYYCGGGCRLHSYIHTGSLYNEDSNCKIIKHCYEKIWLNIS